VSNPYEEAGKSFERGMARYNGEQVTPEMLPKPSVRRTATASWQVRDPAGKPNWMISIEVEKTSRGRKITLGQGDQRIIIGDLEHHVIDEVLYAITAAKLWKDTPDA
jgi:hypothetical protein